MRGSRIAKQIIDEQRRDAKRKKIVLEIRKAMLRRRGESNEYKCSNKQTTDGVVGKEHPSKTKYQASLYRREQ